MTDDRFGVERVLGVIDFPPLPFLLTMRNGKFSLCVEVRRLELAVLVPPSIVIFGGKYMYMATCISVAGALRYSVFRWLAYYWYFEILSIAACSLTIRTNTGNTEYIRELSDLWVVYPYYGNMPSISEMCWEVISLGLCKCLLKLININAVVISLEAKPDKLNTLCNGD